MQNYNSYYPMSYQPIYQQSAYQPQQMMPVQNQVQVPHSSQGGVNWVQGEAGARSWLTTPNTTALLMDSETDRFYLKSTDVSGMPLPLRVFEYREITASNASKNDLANEPKTISEYATKRELEAFKTEIRGFIEKKEKHEDVDNG